MDLKKNEHIKRLDLQRRAVSHKTPTSWKEVPHESYIYEPDVTNFEQEYISLKGNVKGINFNTIMLKVIAEGLKSAPILNSHFYYNAEKVEGNLHTLKKINIGIPWTLLDGKMITPTIEDMSNITLCEIGNQIQMIRKKIENTDFNELLYDAAAQDTIDDIKNLNVSAMKRAIDFDVIKYKITELKGGELSDYKKIPESEKLIPKDILNSGVTVSNISSLYKNNGFFALLEILPPQIFAVGISSIQEKPGVYIDDTGNKVIGIRKFLPMCLSFDHRAIDFGDLVPFLKRLDGIFENPEEIHGW